VKLKLAAFQFQKYGMIEGVVRQISADATEAPSANTRSDALQAGMQVSSEINLGTRTILEYVLSPVQKAWHEAGRER
jgi:HlyD family secretion protein